MNTQFAPQPIPTPSPAPDLKPISAEGFESQNLAVKPATGFGNSQLFLNGQPAPVGAKKGQYQLRRNDGTLITAYFKNSGLDMTPTLMLGDQSITIAESLPWYQLVWSGIPIVLLFIGGAIGGALGGAAFAMNVQIFRTTMPMALRYLVSALVSGAALVLWLLIIFMIRR